MYCVGRKWMGVSETSMERLSNGKQELIESRKIEDFKKKF